MHDPSTKKALIAQLRNRMGEVAEHRARRWLEELEQSTGRSVKDQLLQRLGEVSEALAKRWLDELDARLGWLDYRKDQTDFCYGVGFGDCEDCRPADDHLLCPNYEYCKAESEAEWPEKKP